MHPYLQYLLADIRAAHRGKDQVQLSGQDDITATFTEIETWISGHASQPVGYYCGLKAEDFPPGNQFSEAEVVQICKAFRAMLSTWNAEVDLPENMPPLKQYQLMVGLLEEEFTPMQFGTLHFDFCTGYAPDCELREYCQCLDCWKEDLHS